MIEMPARFVSLASGPTPPDRQAECILAYSRRSIDSDKRNRGRRTGVVGRSPSVLVLVFFPHYPECSFVPVNRPNELRA